MAKDPEEQVKENVLEIFALEKNIESIENELAQNEHVKALLQMQKEYKKQIDDFWKTVEQKMIDEDIKSIKGEWGTLTINERTGWITTEELPAKFYKKVVDTSKLTKTYQLEGKEPKGAHKTVTKYLVKRLK